MTATSTPSADLIWLLYRLRELLTVGSRLGDCIELEPILVEHQRKLLTAISAAAEVLSDPQALLTDQELLHALEARCLVSTLLRQVPEDALYGELARRGHLMLEAAQNRGTVSVLLEVLEERHAQERKWGQQNHPWLEPMQAELASPAAWLGLPSSGEARSVVEYHAERGTLSYSAILVEEVCEAVDCRDDESARRELVQVAAVAVAAVEAIDRRTPNLPETA